MVHIIGQQKQTGIEKQQVSKTAVNWLKNMLPNLSVLLNSDFL